MLQTFLDYPVLDSISVSVCVVVFVLPRAGSMLELRLDFPTVFHLGILALLMGMLMLMRENEMFPGALSKGPDIPKLGTHGLQSGARYPLKRDPVESMF